MNLIFLPSISESKLVSHYQRAFKNAIELYIVSAYLTSWDIEEPLGNQCKSFRFIVGKDFGITRKQACLNVIGWLNSKRRGQFLVAEDIDGFHPKAIFWKEADGFCYALVGSSNLSQAAFSTNYEANGFSKIDSDAFAQVKYWLKGIESRCVVLSEAWLEQYCEASQPKLKPSRLSKSKADRVFDLTLPLPDDTKRVAEILKDRRRQMRSFEKTKNKLKVLFRDAASSAKWDAVDNDEFYRELNSLWYMGVNGCRFQGAGWERQGKGSDFREFSRSLVRVLGSTEFERDDVVAEEIDRLGEEKVSTRKALFSEMLCQFFPSEYHVLDKPVKDWLESTGFTPPSKASEGIKYIDSARKLRVALLRATQYPAKNLAELDVLIWLARNTA